jgi:hypothetical protein
MKNIQHDTVLQLKIICIKYFKMRCKAVELENMPKINKELKFTLIKDAGTLISRFNCTDYNWSSRSLS